MRKLTDFDERNWAPIQTAYERPIYDDEIEHNPHFVAPYQHFLTVIHLKRPSFYLANKLPTEIDRTFYIDVYICSAYMSLHIKPNHKSHFEYFEFESKIQPQKPNIHCILQT